MGYFTWIYSSELPHRARAVYMYLSDRSDREGKCYPAIGTIARELKLSRSTVKRALTDLVLFSKLNGAPISTLDGTILA